MICPACGANYPAGTVRCRRCEVLLVAESLDADSQSIGGDSPRVLWSGADAVLFSALVDALSSEGIPLYQSVLHDSAAGAFGRFPLGFGSHAAGYEIRVSEGDLGAAQVVMESMLAGAVEIVSEEEDGDAAEFSGLSGASPKWRAADAIAEVWRGENGEWAAYLCDVLRENQIRARVASEAGMPRRVLVRPGEEAAARHVLQAIEGAAPLERGA